MGARLEISTPIFTNCCMWDPHLEILHDAYTFRNYNMGPHLGITTWSRLLGHVWQSEWNLLSRGLILHSSHTVLSSLGLFVMKIRLTPCLANTNEAMDSYILYPMVTSFL